MGLVPSAKWGCWPMGISGMVGGFIAIGFELGWFDVIGWQMEVGFPDGFSWKIQALRWMGMGAIYGFFGGLGLVVISLLKRSIEQRRL